MGKRSIMCSPFLKTALFSNHGCFWAHRSLIPVIKMIYCPMFFHVSRSTHDLTFTAEPGVRMRTPGFYVDFIKLGFGKCSTHFSQGFQSIPFRHIFQSEISFVTKLFNGF